MKSEVYLLPEEIPLPDRSYLGSHCPAEESRYSEYRPCLRWEAGFICQYCYLHESDLFWLGSEGSGLFSVEHYELRSQRPDLEAEFENCLYCCRFCNIARGSLPVKESKSQRRLLHPRKAGWGENFSLEKCVMKPSKSRNATYTAECYDLEDPRKTRLRRARKESIAECRRVLEKGPELLTQIKKRGRFDAGLELYLIESVEAARFQLDTYLAIPVDSDENCRCRSLERLPDFIIQCCQS